MEGLLHVRPIEGLRVRDPATLQHLPEDGAQVPRTPYWLRRLRMGDVELVERAEAERKRTSTKRKTSQEE